MTFYLVTFVYLCKEGEDISSGNHNVAVDFTKSPPEDTPPGSKRTVMAKHVEDALAWLESLTPEDTPSAHERIDLESFTFDEMQDLMKRGFQEKKFRTQQLYTWLYQHKVDSFDEMTNLSKAFRSKLNRLTNLSPLTHTGSHEASDGTTKLTFMCRDKSVVETVFIPSEGRNTLCISSQVGCAMGCTFCWTAKMGLHRHLTTAEIVDQVLQARRIMGDVNGHIGNIVFMGMGEPLHNYDNVVRAIHIITDPNGLDFSRRKITVSTSGLVTALEKLGHDVDVNIAISLNGTTNEQRSSIMPVNDRWDIDELLDVLRRYPLDKRQRITFEYVMIQGLNDTMDDAKRLVRMLRGLPSKVNLIPFNPHPNSPFLPPSEDVVDAFRDYLVEKNLSCFRRKTRGQDEMAACGQLGKPGEKEPAHVRKKLAPFREKAERIQG